MLLHGARNGSNDEEATMDKVTVFKDNRGQTVRFSESIALPENVTHVDVVALGRARLLTPAEAAWDSWFDGPSVTSDYMSERKQLSQ